MHSFSIGIWTFVGLLLGPLMAAINFGIRRVINYLMATEHRPRPFWAWALLFSLFGAFGGTLWQNSGPQLLQCRAEGGSTLECIMPEVFGRQ